MYQVADALQSDYFVEIYVGSEQKPFLVQSTVLTRVSEYFKEAIANSPTSTSTRKVTMRFQNDDIEAWTVLLYWITTKIWPQESVDSASLMIRCWALGEKFGIVRFQDEAMMELLYIYANGMALIDDIKAAFVMTKPGSKLREIAADQMVSLLNDPDQTSESLGIDKWEPIPGLASAIVNAYQRARKVDFKGHRGLLLREIDGEPRWKDFLVGDEHGLRWTPSMEPHWEYDWQSEQLHLEQAAL